MNNLISAHSYNNITVKLSYDDGLTLPSLRMDMLGTMVTLNDHKYRYNELGDICDNCLEYFLDLLIDEKIVTKYDLDTVMNDYTLRQQIDVFNDIETNFIALPLYLRQDGLSYQPFLKNEPLYGYYYILRNNPTIKQLNTDEEILSILKLEMDLINKYITGDVHRLEVIDHNIETVLDFSHELYLDNIEKDIYIELSNFDLTMDDRYSATICLDRIVRDLSK